MMGSSRGGASAGLRHLRREATGLAVGVDCQRCGRERRHTSGGEAAHFPEHGPGQGDEVEDASHRDHVAAVVGADGGAADLEAAAHREVGQFRIDRGGEMGLLG